MCLHFEFLSHTVTLAESGNAFHFLVLLVGLDVLILNECAVKSVDDCHHQTQLFSSKVPEISIDFLMLGVLAHQISNEKVIYNPASSGLASCNTHYQTVDLA
jgi:hypothetical protein